MTTRTGSSRCSSSSSRRWVSVATFTVLPRLTRPASASTSPETSPSSVDLPAPFTPRMPVRSPGAMRHSTSWRTSRVAVGDRRVEQVDDVLAEPRDRERLQRDLVADLGHVRDQRVRRVDAELRLRRAGGRAAAQPRELLAGEVLPARLDRPRTAGRARRAAGCRRRSRRRRARRSGRAPPTSSCTPRRGTTGRASRRAARPPRAPSAASGARRATRSPRRRGGSSARRGRARRRRPTAARRARRVGAGRPRGSPIRASHGMSPSRPPMTSRVRASPGPLVLGAAADDRRRRR